MDQNDVKPPDEAPLLPGWAIWGGVSLLLLTAVAAPFYNQVLAGMIWAGETIKTICGW